MDIGPFLTSWTIRIALVFYGCVVVGEAVRGTVAGGVDRSGPGTWDRLARFLWTVGCLTFLVHLVCAFHFYHGWSHAEAFAHTAAETDRLLGVAFGWGIYFNHLFTLVWVADVTWWWVAPERYRSRPLRWHLAIHGFMLFIAINGAIVFESGPTRWAGIPFSLLLMGLLARALWRSHE